MQSESTMDKSSHKGLAGRMMATVGSHPKATLLVLAVIFCLVLFKDELASDEPVIDLIEVPKELSEKASTNLAITRQLVDAMAQTARARFERGIYPLGNLERLRTPPKNNGDKETPPNPETVDKKERKNLP